MATVRIVLVTPKMAEKWLESNTRNRKTRTARVVTFAKILQEGDWELTGDAVVFDENGVLLNGQHRLAGIVAAGIAAELVVLKGIPTKAQDVMDTVALRQMADQLKLRGETDVNTLASALVWTSRLNLIEATDGELGVNRPHGDLRPTHKQLFRVLEDNPDIRDSVKKTKNVRIELKMMPGLTVAMHLRMYRLDSAECDLFWEKLRTGEELKASNPIYKLRQGLIINATSSRKMKDFRMAGLIGLAWNLWRDNEEVRTKGLRWIWTPTRKEPFPLPQ